MLGKETISSQEKESDGLYDAIFILPAYPFPQKPIGFNCEGVVERIAGLPKKDDASGFLFDTHLRVLASVQMAKKINRDHGRSPLVVCMSGKIRGWMEKPFSEIMADKINALTENGMNILKESNSYDLFSEIDEIVRIKKERQIGKSAIVTDSIQAKRINKLINKGQMISKDEIVTIEAVLTNKDYTGIRASQFSDIIEKLHKSNFWKFWKVRESVAANFPRLANIASKQTRVGNK